MLALDIMIDPQLNQSTHIIFTCIFNPLVGGTNAKDADPLGKTKLKRSLAPIELILCRSFDCSQQMQTITLVGLRLNQEYSF